MALMLLHYGRSTVGCGAAATWEAAHSNSGTQKVWWHCARTTTTNKLLLCESICYSPTGPFSGVYSTSKEPGATPTVAVKSRRAQPLICRGSPRAKLSDTSTLYLADISTPTSSTR